MVVISGVEDSEKSLISPRIGGSDDDGLYIYLYIYTGWNDKIVVLKKITLQLNFKTFMEKINSGNLIM